MQQHYMTRIFNFIIVVGCAFTIALSSYKLFFEKISTRLTSPMPAIGNIVDLNNKVKHKKTHLFSWDSATNKSIVHGNDLIYTHKNSDVSVKLKDKVLKVSPETMIKIESTKKISIGEGEVELEFDQSDSELEIVIGKNKYIIESNKAKLNIKKTADTAKFAVNSGSLKIRKQGSKRTFEINQKQELIINEQASNVISSNMKLIEPVDKATYFTTSKEKIHFKVKTLKESRILISEDFQFQKTLINKSIDEQAKFSLTKGHYYWKIKVNKDESETRSFQVIKSLSPVINLLPKNNTIENFYTKYTEVKLSWEQKVSDSFVLNIYDLEDNLIHSKQLKVKNYLWRTNYSGKIKWQVTSTGMNTKTNISQFNYITLNKVEFDRKKPLVIELKNPNQKVEFGWQKNKSTSYTLFELSDDPNFKNIIISKKLLRTKTKITFPKVGVFYWRSNSISNKGKKVLNLPVKVLIQPTPPPKKPKKLPNLKLKLQSHLKTNIFFDFFIPKAIASSRGKVTLDWPALSDAKFYEIEIYSDKSLKNKIKTIKSQTSKYKWTAPRAGDFYWRYRYQDFWGRYSPYSEQSKLLLTKVKKIRPRLKVIKPVKKLELKSKVKIKKQVVRKNQSIITSFAPSLINYKYTDSNNNDYNIDGNSINGWDLKYKKQLRPFHFITSQLSIATGSVFNDQDFINRKVELNYTLPLYGVITSVGINFFQLPSYESINAQAKFKENTNHFLFVGSAKYLWQKYDILSEFHLGAGSGLLYKFSASYEIYKNMKYSITSKLSYQNLSINSSEDTIEFQQFQLSIGPQYNF